jgi:hypothetical protein
MNAWLYYVNTVVQPRGERKNKRKDHHYADEQQNNEIKNLDESSKRRAPLGM